MNIYIGSDHRGFTVKSHLVSWLESEGHTVEDCGNTVYDPADDYPDYASCAAERVSNGSEDARGILLCGSGIGVCIVANKYPGVRAMLGVSVEHVEHGRQNDDVNVLCLAADMISEEEAHARIRTFLNTPFSDATRHVRRKKKILKIENGL